MEFENRGAGLLPPPLPPHKEPFSAKAGGLSLGIFLVVIGLVFAQSVLKKAGFAAPPPVLLAGFAAAILLLVVGVVLGIVALAGAGGRQGRRAVVRGVLGVGTNGLLIFIAVTNFVAGRARALETQRKVEQSVARLRQQMKASFDPTNGIKTDIKPINQFRQSLEAASAESQGEQKLQYQASAAYMAKMQAAAMEFSQAIKKFTNANVFGAHTVVTQEQLKEKRQLIEEFQVANEKFASFLARSETVFSNELVNVKVDRSAIPKIVASFRAGQSQVAPQVMEVRRFDSEIARSSLEMIDLLDKNWGAWKCDPGTGRLLSNDAQFRASYNQLLRRIQDAQAQELAVQAKLVNAP